MKGAETWLLALLDGAKNRYIVPVYQRKYDWKQANCARLYQDLVKLVKQNRNSHFFGNIVSMVSGTGAKIEYLIIDGQQRITTVTLLLLAMRNLLHDGVIQSENDHLADEIDNMYLSSMWGHGEEKIKLRLTKKDRPALQKLFDDDAFDESSKLTANYHFFCQKLIHGELTVDEVFDALSKLEIIGIMTGPDDDPQLIFESLNSTGEKLQEGDKIRNHILMGLTASKQEEYYDKYWEEIEECTNDDVSAFVRDYLSVKTLSTPIISNVYEDYKEYVEKENIPIEELLSDMKSYARIYKKLLTSKSGLHNVILDDCLFRMSRLEITVARPFFMEVFRLHQDGKLTTDELSKILLMTETYLFRRNICEVPTNALNKIFVNLNREVLRYDGTTKEYIDKLAYALTSKRESGRFPDDTEFAAALSEKQVYLMRGKFKTYLFERLENYGTVETKDVYTHIDQGTYTIEHIMPQHLTAEWTEALGPDYESIHQTWLHRLANLTLTGYNPDLSNHSFLDKRDDPNGGYATSGLRMNQKIAQLDSWGLPELEKRSEELVERAKEIWSYPKAQFQPAVKEYDSCSLDDESVELTGRDIFKYSYQNLEQPVSSWIDMFEKVISMLHRKDPTVLLSIAYSNSELSAYVSNKEDNLRSTIQISDNLFVEKNTSTFMKLQILRRLFPLYDADPLDLVFFLKDEAKADGSSKRADALKRYWEYALPSIQAQNAHRPSFGHCNPTANNAINGSFGISGFSISCIANIDSARVDFWMSSSDVEKNKAAFYTLFEQKEQIESDLGIKLEWYPGEKYKGSWICYTLKDVSLYNENDWPKMRDFHTEWSDKICDALLAHLQHEEEPTRLNDIAGILREWTISQHGVNENLAKCNRTYTRFTTDAMSEILPDIPNAPSGWNTDNHYFYEIINRSGASVYIQFALSSKNATEEFLALCDRINEYYPAKIGKENWQWRCPFKTTAIEIGDELCKEDIFAGLDECLKEIVGFEADLKEKLGI